MLHKTIQVLPGLCLAPSAEHLHLDSASVVARLKEIARVLKRYRSRPKTALLLAGPALCRLALGHGLAACDLAGLLRAGRSLETLSAVEYAALRRRLLGLPKAAQAEAWRELTQARQALHGDDQERDLVRRVVANNQAFAGTLVNALTSLERGHTRSASQRVALAVRHAHQAHRLSAEIAARGVRCRQEATRIITRASLATSEVSR